MLALSIYLRDPSPDMVVLDTSGREKYVCNRHVKSNDDASGKFRECVTSMYYKEVDQVNSNHLNFLHSTL